ncbi:MAG TPA: hypothetical protein VMZ31_13485 [Phycisphaerae bacterium]|nr:hypothetical protein [Phycisphaerae bacterium]
MHMVRTCITIIAFLQLSVSFAWAARPTQDQVARLAAATWREVPTSLDITYYLTRQHAPLSPEAIRRSVEYAYKMNDNGVVSDMPARKDELEAEVQRILSQQGKAVTVKQRIRQVGDSLYRLDRFFPSDTKEGFGDTPSLTLVNGGNPSQKDYLHFEYDYNTQIATVYNDRSRWRQQPMMELGGYPGRAKFQLTLTMGDIQDVNGKKQFVPSQEKMAHIVAGTHKVFEMDIAPEQGDSKRVRIVLTGKGYSSPSLVLVCDAADYSRISVAEGFDPKTGARIMLNEYGEYGSDGIPRKIVMTEYLPDGQIKERQELAIDSIVINSSISQDIFRFMPPDGFGIVDRRGSVPFAINPQDRPNPEAAIKTIDTIGPYRESHISLPSAATHSASEKTLPGNSSVVSSGTMPAGAVTTTHHVPWYLVAIAIIGASGAIIVLLRSWYMQRRKMLNR